MIYIEILKEILTADLFLCFISGYIFVFIFNFISSTKNPKDYQHMIVKSIIVGYILVIFYHIIPSLTGNNKYADIAFFIIITIVSAYILGRFWTGTLLLKVFKKLKIKATPNEYLWYDLEDKSNKVLWVRAIISAQDLDVLGQLDMFEEYQRKPMIVLTRYIRRNCIGEVKEDCSKDPTQKIVLDTDKCDRIELVYNKDSTNITYK